MNGGRFIKGQMQDKHSYAEALNQLDMITEWEKQINQMKSTNSSEFTCSYIDFMHKACISLHRPCTMSLY